MVVLPSILPDHLHDRLRRHHHLHHSQCCPDIKIGCLCSSSFRQVCTHNLNITKCVVKICHCIPFPLYNPSLHPNFPIQNPKPLLNHHHQHRATASCFHLAWPAARATSYGHAVVAAAACGLRSCCFRQRCGAMRGIWATCRRVQEGGIRTINL